MQYRSELDGLRAIAVLAVLFFHARLPFFDGGFVGVDVFFVLSGYLVTTIILNDLNANKFSIITFYERRIRRILPAMFFVLFCCVPVTLWLLIPVDLLSFFKSFRYTLIFISNIFFYQDSGYFSNAAELKPLLHTWSLSVEMQYYLIVPIILLCLHKTLRSFSLLAIILLSGGSFIYMLYNIDVRPTYTFFMLQTRFWELGLGAVLAFLFTNYSSIQKTICSSSLINNLGSLSGITLICTAFFTLNRTTPFPGVAALLPTLGTALVIMFTQKETYLHRILSFKIFVGLGLISYSVYLWHHPLLSFARIYVQKEPPMTWKLILLALSVVLAYISWRWIEQPFRNRLATPRKKLLAYTGTSMALLFIIAFVAKTDHGLRFRYDIPESVTASLKMNHISGGQACLDGLKCEEGIIFYGDLDAPKDNIIALFGDSHAERVLEVFDNYGKENNTLIAFGSVPSCPPLLGVDIFNGEHAPGFCENLSQKQHDFVKNNKIQTTVLAARWSAYTGGEYDKPMEAFFIGTQQSNDRTQDASRKFFASSMEETIKAYNDLGTNTLLILQVPEQDKRPVDIYYRASHKADSYKAVALDEFSVSLQKHLDHQKYYRGTINQLATGKFKVINPDAAFITNNETCTVGTVDFSYYTDINHLSKQGAELVFDEIISKFLPPAE